MAGVNKAILIGNLGKDPETRYSQNGQPITNFSVATSEKWTGKDGQAQERTEWHRIVTFGRLAETCRDYLSKGKQVYIEGRIQTRDWEDKDGNKRYTTEIVAQTVRFLGRAGDGRPQAADNNASYGNNSGGGGYDNSGGGYDNGQPPPIGDDDVPF
jgi:single-strand DNA-binding protein